MNGPVHTAIGISTGVVATVFIADKLPFDQNIVTTTLFLGAITVGSTFPDLDLPGRPLGFLGHRKLTHTMLIPAICCILIYLAQQSKAKALSMLVVSCLVGFTWGYVMHIFADLFQSKGVPLFWPLIWSNVHIANMPVKYDKIWFFFYIIILTAVCVIFFDAPDVFTNLLTNSPALLLTIVVALLLVHKKTKKGK